MKTKPFSKQFTECQKEGFCGKGDFKPFKDFPNLFPAFPNEKMQKALENGEWTGIETIACLRFGGQCRSNNKGCRKLRGFKD